MKNCFRGIETLEICQRSNKKEINLKILDKSYSINIKQCIP